MKKRNVILLALVILAGGVLAGMQFGRRSYVSTVGDMRRQPDKITELLQLIRTQYVDSVSLDSITEAVMPQIVGVLDPHSVYIPARDFAAANEALEGGFGGIGVKFSMVVDTAVVTGVIPGGPGQRAGLVGGDRIVRVDTVPVAGLKMNQDKVVGMLRGEMGTTVELGVERRGELFTVSVTRGQIPINSVTAAFMIEPGVAYIKLEQFSRTTQGEVRAALTRMQSMGADRVVLDLRGNTGGYLDQGISLANEFLPRDKMIVYTENRYGKREEVFSTGRGRFRNMPIAVLVDQDTASSSEILAGALQDNDRGIIVGRRTFGKGLVQEQVPFPDGSAVRLTVARYYTPTGRSIQKPYDDADKYQMEAYTRYNEFFSADSVRFADSLRFTTPGGRTVYGGGGIMPDVFVPLDTTYMNRYYMLSQVRALPYRFALRWADRHRDEVNAVSTAGGLNALLGDGGKMGEEYRAFAAADGVRATGEEWRQAKDMLTTLIRADLGRMTPLDDTGFYLQYYAEDQTLKVAVEKIR
jgi:carboxyl-terminal processing protease